MLCPPFALEKGVCVEVEKHASFFMLRASQERRDMENSTKIFSAAFWCTYAHGQSQGAGAVPGVCDGHGSLGLCILGAVSLVAMGRKRQGLGRQMEAESGKKRKISLFENPAFNLERYQHS